ncbi:MAG: acyl-CoA dehydrogenase family protein [Gammaproteobacteria bacterium]|nr:acyl-CoA dehydrogenase family protein [Gammaproteobacteria bacterium]MBV1730761.1 acyl-CoA dehydrogenase family protein [Hydrogenophaga sp.]
MNIHPTPDCNPEDRVALIDTVRRFPPQTITPNVNAWDETGDGPDGQRSDTIPA